MRSIDSTEPVDSFGDVDAGHDPGPPHLACVPGEELVGVAAAGCMKPLYVWYAFPRFLLALFDRDERAPLFLFSHPLMFFLAVVVVVVVIVVVVVVQGVRGAPAGVLEDHGRAQQQVRQDPGGHQFYRGACARAVRLHHESANTR